MVIFAFEDDGRSSSKARMYPTKGTVRGSTCWSFGQAPPPIIYGDGSCSAVMKIWELVKLMMCKCIFSYFIKMAFPGSLSLIFMVRICSSRESANSSPIVRVKFIASWTKGRHQCVQACTSHRKRKLWQRLCMAVDL